MVAQIGSTLLMHLSLRADRVAKEQQTTFHLQPMLLGDMVDMVLARAPQLFVVLHA